MKDRQKIKIFFDDSTILMEKKIREWIDSESTRDASIVIDTIAQTVLNDHATGGIKIVITILYHFDSIHL